MHRPRSISRSLRSLRLNPAGAFLVVIALSGCGGGGGSSSSSSTPPPPPVNQAPTAAISASTTDGYAALTVDFDASASRDPDGTISRYDWDFGDGAVAGSGIRVAHTFTQPGGYNVRLTVTDDDGDAATVLQNIRVRGTELSGTVQILSSSAVDSDVNDRFSQPTANNDTFTAQPVPNPVRLGGFVNLPGTGDPDGNLFDAGDAADFYAIRLTGNEVIVLSIADAEADLDLHLRDAGGAMVDASVGIGRTESIDAPGPGDYFIEVLPYDGPTNLAGGSNYVLSVGQNLSTAGRDPVRLSDPFVADELLVAPRQPADASRLKRRFALDERGRAGRFLRSRIGPDSLPRARTATARRLPLPAGLSAAQRAKYRTLLVQKTLQRDPTVAHAEVNVIMHSNLEPDDGLYPLQWHLREINLPGAWDITTGAPSGLNDVLVAVVDTGILPTHPDFLGQLVAGYDFIADPSRARDFSGIDNDPTDEGDLAYGGSSSFHGTHVAGTVAARTDNGDGVAGVSWHARIMPLRALGVDGGTTYDVMQAVRYAAGLDNDSGRLPDRSADIINLSLGSPFYAQSAQDTFTEVRNRGVLVISSAGNESSANPSYPAAYNGVVAVSATTIDGTLAPYSNFGSSIDVAAPGGYNATDRNGDGFSDGVVSTLGDDSNPGPPTLGYGALNGTSMAAPHVAGVAALMKAVHPGLTPAEFDAALAAGELTDDLGAPGYDTEFGHGLINAQKAVLTALELDGGAGSDPGPVLGASLSSVDLGVLASSQIVRLSNLGSGNIVIADTIPSQSWLSIIYVEVPPSVDRLGDYELRVDRSGLTEGAWNATARFVPVDPDTNSVTVTVTLQVAGSNPAADAGLFYVIAVNEDGSSEGNADVVTADNGEYHWTLTDLPAGSYRIFAGSDMDNDNFLCDAGESCGAYRTLDAQERVTVDPATTPAVTGLDFVAEFRAVISAVAAGAAAGGEQRAGDTAGIPFRRPGTLGSPAREARSAAEQR
ncbi:MAG: S8 family serine peptidase [Pseudomonadales bacterium]